MQRFVIETEDDSKKSRSFGGTCLGMFTANFLYEVGSSGKCVRPVWAVFAGTETELKPFVANLRCGRKATIPNKKGDDERIEFLKGERFQVFWQKEAEGAMVTIHHPELFRLDPGMTDPVEVKFITLVPEDWAAEQQDLDPFAVDHVLSLKDWTDRKIPLSVDQLSILLPTAYLFAAYLDRRTHMPLITDGRFYLQILCSALEKGLASFPGNNLRGNRDTGVWGIHTDINFQFSYTTQYSYRDMSLESIGLRHAIAFMAKQSTLEEFLKEEVSLFFEATSKMGGFRPLIDLLDPF